MNILITGAGGFLGHYIVQQLLDQGHHLWLLSRKKKFAELTNKYAPYSDQVTVIQGDLTDTSLFRKDHIKKELEQNLDCILHAAAMYDLKASRAKCFIHNVVGTQNLLFFISQCEKKIDFHYVSSIAVAGDFKGIYTEDHTDVGQNFLNPYAATKYESEQAVRQHAKNMKSLSIYRLGILVGNSIDGSFDKIDGPYYFLKTISRIKPKLDSLDLLKVLPFPYKKESSFPIIPVDYAANFIAKSLLSRKKKKLRCYHIVGAYVPKLHEFVEDAFRFFQVKQRPVALPNTVLNSPLFKMLDLPEQLLEYAYSEITYDSTQALKDFPKTMPKSYQDFKVVFFQAALNDFMNSSQRGARG